MKGHFLSCVQTGGGEKHGYLSRCFHAEDLHSKLLCSTIRFLHFLTIVVRTIVMSSNVQMYQHTQKGKYPGKSSSQMCGKGTFLDVRLKRYKLQCCHVWNSDLFFNIDFGMCVINYVVPLPAGWKCFHVLSLRA